MNDKHLLLVEDNQDDAFLMQRALKKTGFAFPVQLVEDGQEALNYIAGAGPYQQRETYPIPAMTLLDLKLPYVSGLEVLEWIRQQPEFRHLLVVILTSSRERRDIDQAYKLGANSYLVKPAGTEELNQMVASLNDYWFCRNQFHPDFW